MQFVADGPDIPLAVLRAQDEGRLALFCGAGISVPAGLPLFKQLVLDTYAGLLTAPSALERSELEKENFDRVLNLLEQRMGSEMRRQVIRRLTTAPDHVSAAHDSILTLAADSVGRIHLVTTNYDRLFETSRPGLRCSAAPKLPVPKPGKWNDIVHIHGQLDANDPDGKDLVLTSADFGRAYLVEQWASRFLSELFNHFDLLFVGYSVTDPVLRYLVDAMAAERASDPRIHSAFALAPIESTVESSKVDWEARGITPILYEKSGDHQRLYGTLSSWARIWNGGLQSKVNIVRDVAGSDPSILPSETVSQFCWAVEDVGGARELARLGAAANIKWLDVFEAEGLLQGRRPHAVDNALCGMHSLEGIDLAPAQGEIARWLERHIGSPALAGWVVKAGARLNPAFAEGMRRAAESATSLAAPLAKIWSALSGSLRLTDKRGPFLRLRFQNAVKNEQWSPRLRQDVLEALSPRVEIRPSWHVENAASAGTATVGELLSFDCELEAGGFTGLLIEALRRRADWDNVLLDLALDLLLLLRRALDYHAALDGASESFDPSYIQHPSLEPHEQNRNFGGWTHLIELLRQAFLAAQAAMPSIAQALTLGCSVQPYPVFRRLVLYMARSGALDAASLLRLIAQSPENWLWSPHTELELFRSLGWLWRGLDAEGRRALEALLVEGPQRRLFRGDLDTRELEEARSRWVWKRLARLKRDGAVLDDATAAALAQIQREHPDWALAATEREDFPVWIEASCGPVSGIPPDGLLALPDEALLKLLKEPTVSPRDLYESWADATTRDTIRAIAVLNRMLEDGFVDPDFWSHALWPFREKPGDAVVAGLLGVLERLPSGLLASAKTTHAAVSALRGLCKGLEEDTRTRILSIWDRLLPASLLCEAADSDDRLTDAVNHPAGILVDALFLVLRSRGLERAQGVPEDVRARLEAVLGAEGAAARAGRALVASRMALLWDLDQGWTARDVVPVLDWSDEADAIPAWQGFLWAPQVRTSLWRAVKPHFLLAFDHIEKLDRQRQNMATLLASAAVEDDGAVTSAEAAECLRKLGDGGRRSVAWWLERKLDGAGEKAATLWRSRVEPWLRSAWPRDEVLRKQGTSEGLANAAAHSREAFDEAVDCIVNLVGPLERAGCILQTIEELQLASLHPASCLQLLDKLTPDQPPQWFGDLGRALDAIRAAAPDLETRPQFRRLREVAARFLV